LRTAVSTLVPGCSVCRPAATGARRTLTRCLCRAAPSGWGDRHGTAPHPSASATPFRDEASCPPEFRKTRLRAPDAAFASSTRPPEQRPRPVGSMPRERRRRGRAGIAPSYPRSHPFLPAYRQSSGRDVVSATDCQPAKPGERERLGWPLESPLSSS
jgi:hypothetical protein